MPWAPLGPTLVPPPAPPAAAEVDVCVWGNKVGHEKNKWQPFLLHAQRGTSPRPRVALRWWRGASSCIKWVAAVSCEEAFPSTSLPQAGPPNEKAHKGRSHAVCRREKRRIGGDTALDAKGAAGQSLFPTGMCLSSGSNLCHTLPSKLARHVLKERMNQTTCTQVSLCLTVCCFFVGEAADQPMSRRRVPPHAPCHGLFLPLLPSCYLLPNKHIYNSFALFSSLDKGSTHTLHSFSSLNSG